MLGLIFVAWFLLWVVCNWPWPMDARARQFLFAFILIILIVLIVLGPYDGGRFDLGAHLKF